VGALISSAVPMGILMGPMMCGINLAFFKQRRGQPVEFGDLFKGFDYFGPSLIASLLYIVPIMAVVIPAYIIFYLGMILSMAAQTASDDPNPFAAFGFLVMFMIFIVVILVAILLISVGFTFSYALIVERKLQGFDAVKLSFRAAMANFWRLFLMMILTGLLGLAGILLCYVGVFLALPISYAAIDAAYEQVFGLHNPNEVESNLPPPPPVFT
jgi:membrane-anchored glycerophosphoryl diester phosphodiesterase (GDPDase)